MYVRLLFACLICTAVQTNLSHAGFFASLLTDGQVNMLEDFDREIFLDSDGAGGYTLGDTINVGGYLMGVWQIETVQSLPGNVTSTLPTGGKTMTIAFITEVLTKVDSGVAGPNRFQYTLGAASDQVWTDMGLVRNDDGTLITLYEDSNGGIANGAADGTLAPVLAALDSGQDGNLVFEFGFTGAGGLAAGNEYWDASSATDSTLGSGLQSTPVNYFAALNVTVDHDPTVELEEHDFLGANTGPTQVQIFGGIETPATLTNALPVNTDTDIYINPNIVPEPTSFAIFGIMGLAGLGVRRRRV